MQSSPKTGLEMHNIRHYCCIASLHGPRPCRRTVYTRAALSIACRAGLENACVERRSGGGLWWRPPAS